MSDPRSMEKIVVRLAGDSGDGVQLMGTQFVASTAAAGSDFSTFPDYPAEIRAPAGTTFGVSAYQINLGAGPRLHAPVGHEREDTACLPRNPLPRCEAA